MRKYLFLIYFIAISLPALPQTADEFLESIKNLNHEEKLQQISEYTNNIIYIEQPVAFKLARTSMNIANNSGQNRLVTRSIYDIGYLHYRAGNMDSSLYYLQKSLANNKKESDDKILGAIYNRLGNVYWFLNQQQEAKEYYQKSLEINFKTANHKETAKSLTNLANTYRHWGDFNKAIDFYLQAMDYYKLANFNEGLAWLHFSMGQLFKHLKEYEKALNSINSSVEIYNTLSRVDGDSSGLMICYGQLGDLYRLTGDYQKALQFHNDALRMRIKSGVPVAIADGYMGVGQTYYELKEYDKAIAYIQKSQALREKEKLFAGMTSNYKFLGFIYFDMGNPAKAIQYLEQGLKHARKMHEPQQAGEILLKLSEIYADINNYYRAWQYHYRFSAVNDSLFDAELSKRIASLHLQEQIKEKAMENERLASENKIKQLELEQLKVQQYLFILLIVFSISAIIIFIHINRIKQRDNQILIDKNQEIEKAHDQLKIEIEDRKKIEKEREKLIEELQESLSKIKTLSGLIPICSNCKKVRNDEGYYEQVEEYIMNHSHAEFTHGICPDCVSALYPDFNSE